MGGWEPGDGPVPPPGLPSGRDQTTQPPVLPYVPGIEVAGVVERPKRPKLSTGVFSGDGESAANNVDRWLAETGFGEA